MKRQFLLDMDPESKMILITIKLSRCILASVPNNLALTSVQVTISVGIRFGPTGLNMTGPTAVRLGLGICPDFIRFGPISARTECDRATVRILFVPVQSRSRLSFDWTDLDRTE